MPKLEVVSQKHHSLVDVFYSQKLRCGSPKTEAYSSHFFWVILVVFGHVHHASKPLSSNGIETIHIETLVFKIWCGLVSRQRS